MKKFLYPLLICSSYFATMQANANEIAVQNQSYICERGVELPVTFLTQKNGDAYAVMFIEGKLITLKQQISASGALYVAMDKQDSYRLFTKGDDAMLSYLSNDKRAKEHTLLSSCEADVPKD